jgi:hypothetical protein
MPGKRGEVVLKLPPTPPSLAAGKYQAQLYIGSQVTPDEMAAAELSFQVSPRYSYELSLQPQRHRSFSEGRFNVEVTNHSNVEISLKLTAQDPENNCQFSFTPNPAVIPARQTIKIPLSVRTQITIPGWNSKSYPFVVTGRMEGDLEAARQVHGEWEQAPPDFEVSLLPQAQRSILRGNFTVQVSTFSPDPCEVQLEGSDPQNDCVYQFEPAQFPISSKQAAQASLNVLPRDRDLTREVPFTVTARLALAPHLNRKVSGTWEPVKPSVSLELVPRQQSSATQAYYTVEVRNQSPIDLALELYAWDGENSLLSSVTPGQLTLPANSTRTAQLLVKPRQAQTSPRNQTYSLILSAKLSGTDTVLQQAAGEWTQLSEPGPMRPPGPINLPEPVTFAEPIGMQKPKSRWVQGCVVFLICLILTAAAGFIAGQWVASQGYYAGDEPLIAAIIVWLIGLWISFRMFNRVRKPPSG